MIKLNRHKLYIEGSINCQSCGNKSIGIKICTWDNKEIDKVCMHCLYKEVKKYLLQKRIGR